MYSFSHSKEVQFFYIILNKQLKKRGDKVPIRTIHRVNPPYSSIPHPPPHPSLHKVRELDLFKIDGKGGWGLEKEGQAK